MNFCFLDNFLIFPMFNNGVLYGALQNGKHFFSPNPSMTYEKTDTYAFFSHLWIIEDEDFRKHYR